VDKPDRQESELAPEHSAIVSKVGEKEARRLKARSERNRSLWFGLGMFGVVGWSVAVPVLIGIAVGCWLDSIFHSQISWCLTFLFVGIVSGMLIAWNWIKREGTPR